MTTRILLLLLWIALASTSCLAVDRSKFRTCEQTSFCRRHRDGHSSSLYQYQLEKDSVHFHKDEQQQQQEQESGGLWQSIHRRLAHDGKHKVDPYYRGPPPTLSGILKNTATSTSSGLPEELSWSVHAMHDGMVRIRITEVYGSDNILHKEARVTYDELVLETDHLLPAEKAEWIRSDTSEGTAVLEKLLEDDKNDLDNYMALRYGNDDDENDKKILLIRLKPFSVFLFAESNMEAGPILSMGNQGMMHFEVRRAKTNVEGGVVEQQQEDEKQEEKKHHDKEIVGYWEDGLAIYADGTREEKKDAMEDHRRHLTMTQAELDREGLWEESFGGHTDSKPHGPMSVGLDVSFASQHLFGLPEHASSTQLQTTMGDGAHYQEPYRLYNLDVFEYELDETMALYGFVPLVVSHSATHGTSGVFWFNPTETYVDVMKHNDVDTTTTTTHWMSESGIMDIILLPGPTPAKLYEQYTSLTGKLPLPPMFSLGYHQCRWNYKDEKDVYHVHGKFEELDYPYDVLWLDIEHTDGKRYFTWDYNLFPNPEEMQQHLKSQGRNMVTIVDPHIKRDRDYHIHKEATAKGLYIRDKEGKKDYDGWCWPGSSSYLDFTSSKVREWWAERFAYDIYKGSTPSLFTWNDMNEPSVFNGPEVSMQKDLLNLNGVEHREWHNLYGMLFHRASMEGLVKRNSGGNVRPFVLSRAFFAGSQKYGAIWTGDNTAQWGHLKISAPMLLSLNVASLCFVGADVGGFFGNPDAELMTRWMQAGSYTPFFRGHAHHDSQRKEPWMFGDETLARLRSAAMARYALLPYWYTVFYQSGQNGMPVMRMMWMQYPQQESVFSVDDQYLVGSDLLVKPVTEAGVTQTTVLFPKDDLWYDVDSMEQVKIKASKSKKGVAEIKVSSDIDKIPVYQRGGSVIPRKLRLRRSSLLMQTDPYTLFVALAKNKEASGMLYMDDEESFDHVHKEMYGEAHFSVNFGPSGAISNAAKIGSGWADELESLKEKRMIERIVVMGVDTAPKKISLNDEALEFDFDKKTKVLVIRKPNVSALANWEIVL